MHLSSYENMSRLIQKHRLKEAPGKVLDIGSQRVAGQEYVYRTLFEKIGWEYTGLDIVDGANVDVLAESTEKLPYADETYDLVISGQAFEHIPFFWVTFAEMARVVKQSGKIFLIAPSRGPEHKYPVDCWRFYPDGCQALADWAGLELLSAFTEWEPHEDPGSAPWGDTVGVFHKAVATRKQAPAGSDLFGAAHQQAGSIRGESAMVKSIIGFLGSKIDTASAWTGHFLFAHWLVTTLRPSTITELGVHWGASYFTFCDAVQHNHLDCDCHGVDSWTGDEHAGAYEDDVYSHVKSLNDLYYSLFSTLHHTTFDEALDAFADGSIDLLHIDGCHTYQAVKHDFEAWLPKMSQRGVVLFHDTTEKRDDFGVWRLWDELVERHPSFLFEHSHGLGVLGVGTDLPPDLEQLFELTKTPESAAAVRQYFNDINAFLLTKLKKNDNIVPIQLYFDTGAGFSEAESITKQFNTKATKFVFSFPARHVIALRIDLGNEPCMVTLADIVVETANGETIKLSPTWSNAVHSVSNKFYFAKVDPQFHFFVDREIVGGTASVRLNPIREDGARQLLDWLQGAITSATDVAQQLKHATGENQRLEQESATVSSQLETVQEAANQLTASLEQVRALLAEEQRENHMLKKRVETLDNAITMLRRRIITLVRHRSTYYEHIEGVLSRLWHPRIFYRLWRKGDYKIIKESGLFDAEWYLKSNPDVAAAGIDPLRHFVDYGADEGRDPTPEFDTAWYASKYKSVLRFGMLPFVHYILYGRQRNLRVCDLSPDQYIEWRKLRHRFLEQEFDRDKFLNSFETPPRISIIMPLYNSQENFLEQALVSVRDQIYPHWELCLVDDASPKDLTPVIERVFGDEYNVKFARRAKNGGIAAASNDALAMVTSDYVCFLDHDDVYELHALASMAVAIKQNPDADWFYSDEDKISETGKMYAPIFKPKWSPVFYLACMFTCHLSLYRTERLREIGGFDSEYDGAQDFEMSLRLLRRNPKIVHVPDVLYHWRVCKGSTAMDLDSKPKALIRQQKALNLFLQERGGWVDESPIRGMHEAQFELCAKPMVGIVIPSATRESHLFKNITYVEHLVKSIKKRSTYANYKIYISVNDDIDPKVEAALEGMGCTLVRYTAKKFNLSVKINELVGRCEEEYVILLNDDMEIISDDWIEQMLMWIQQEEIGCVGGKLLFPDNTIQHAGVCFFHIGPGHVYYGEHESTCGFLGSAQVAREYIAVTGACMMFRKTDYQQLGGFDPKLHLNYNDVDFCCKLVTELGKSIVYSPKVKLYHYESVSKSGCTKSELDAINEKWLPVLKEDPYFSRHFVPGSHCTRLDSKTPLEEYCSKP